MRTSKEGKVSLVASEGVVPAVYTDSVGVDTFGVGVTHWAIGEEAFSRLPVAMPSDIDAAVDHALDLFDRVLRQYEEAVNEAVKVSLEQHEFDALVHFTYNVGGPNLRRSRLLKLINAGKKDEAGRTGFHGWLRPPSLRGRRDLESEMFLYGDYGNSPIPVYGTNGQKRLSGRVKVLGRAEVLAMLQEPVRLNTASLAGHSPVARASVDQTKTAWLAKVQKWWAAGNLSLTGLIASFRDLDWTVQLALLGIVIAAGIGGAWFLSSLTRREREKHFLAGVR
jgi:lysozyme